MWFTYHKNASKTLGKSCTGTEGLRVGRSWWVYMLANQHATKTHIAGWNQSQINHWKKALPLSTKSCRRHNTADHWKKMMSLATQHLSNTHHLASYNELVYGALVPLIVSVNLRGRSCSFKPNSMCWAQRHRHWMKNLWLNQGWLWGSHSSSAINGLLSQFWGHQNCTVQRNLWIPSQISPSPGEALWGWASTCHKEIPTDTAHIIHLLHIIRDSLEASLRNVSEQVPAVS